jgi:hypothetical protein
MKPSSVISSVLFGLFVAWLAYAIYAEHRHQQIRRFVYDRAHDVMVLYPSGGTCYARFQRACNPLDQLWLYAASPLRWKVAKYCQSLFDQAQERAFERLTRWCEAEWIPPECCAEAALE